MKINKFIKYLIVSFLLLFFLIVPTGKVIAQEGAEVSIKGEITLFDEGTSSNGGTKTSTSTSNISISKPKGRMPSTGELVKNGLAISGSLLVVTICLVYGLRRHHQKNRKEQ
ncbi:hypothetical protein [Enterococcus caccae]|uniref:LPXTG-domain-containing protein cell wall anchor domain n=1 Tax=Enterococcus caccae ATCC BAA-1240 TaxID=1158612 RepID=R3U941_9ENTE|nr:hypothetical protein [Enterococcus caccae]EOL50469.1 hypothetical protein UC7_00462 [Enterococcus caccae ATCC BAA-1240]EOT59094.1 hypothetical protein I580_02126 [Enterococcus caccae ATCC BAA-1240]OJG25626.1 hypothetical protein RU98_GL000867 [Enterococcus caccae]